jgi:hypothetical protein
VLDTCEDSVKSIFNELSEKRFPLFSCSCYYPRYIAGTRSTSLHAYAAAIDINPVQNPCFNAKTRIILPSVTKSPKYGDLYLNRGIQRDGMVTPLEAEVFARNGFTVWGGMWQIPVDYMHFQTTKAIAKILVTLPSNEASIFWKYYLQNPKLIARDEFFAGDINPDDIRLDLLIERMKKIIERPAPAKNLSNSADIKQPRSSIGPPR